MCYYLNVHFQGQSINPQFHSLLTTARDLWDFSDIDLHVSEFAHRQVVLKLGHDIRTTEWQLMDRTLVQYLRHKKEQDGENNIVHVYIVCKTASVV